MAVVCETDIQLPPKSFHFPYFTAEMALVSNNCHICQPSEDCKCFLKVVSPPCSMQVCPCLLSAHVPTFEKNKEIELFGSAHYLCSGSPSSAWGIIFVGLNLWKLFGVNSGGHDGRCGCSSDVTVATASRAVGAMGSHVSTEHPLTSILHVWF